MTGFVLGCWLAVTASVGELPRGPWAKYPLKIQVVTHPKIMQEVKEIFRTFEDFAGGSIVEVYETYNDPPCTTHTSHNVLGICIEKAEYFKTERTASYEYHYKIRVHITIKNQAIFLNEKYFGSWVKLKNRDRLKRTLFHEIGHSLGFDHHPDIENFMFERNYTNNMDCLLYTSPSPRDS